MPYKPILGEKIVRLPTVIGTSAGSPRPIYTIAGGPIIITSLIAVITTVMDGTACTLRLQHSVGNVFLCGVSGSVALHGEGTAFAITGIFANAMIELETGVLGAGAAGLMSNGITCIEGDIELLNSGNQAGECQWELCFIPLVDAATVTAIYPP